MAPRTTARFCALVVMLVAAACAGQNDGDDGRDASGPSTDQRATAGSVLDEFASRFDPMLEPSGFRVTRAGFTADSNAEDYQEGGTHLAVYVEPLHPLTDQQYIDAIVPVARTFLPVVFDERPGLRSFDVCQEPISDDDEPRPRVQLLVNREQSSRVDWASVDTVELLRGSRATPNTVNLFADDELLESSAWQALEAEAGGTA